jgi:pimeloyl-ACP methyl ester carboxylesterase
MQLPNVRAAVAAALFGIALAGAACAPRQDATSQQPDSLDTDAIRGTAGPIHVDDGGTGGIPVVFVHAYSGDAGHWSEQLAHLRPTRRAIALDLRGHGESAAPAWPGGYAVDSLASDIAAVAGQLGLDRFVLVGHSLGGSAAAAYAGAYPERLAGLVLVSAPGPSPPGMADGILAEMSTNYDSTMARFWSGLLDDATPATKARIEGEKSRLSQETSIELIRAIFSYDPMPAIRAFPRPVLLVDTDADAGETSIHRLAPRLERVVIPGTSHWPQLDKPAAFHEVLDRFLADVSAGAIPDSTALTDTI